MRCAAFVRSSSFLVLGMRLFAFFFFSLQIFLCARSFDNSDIRSSSGSGAGSGLAFHSVFISFLPAVYVRIFHHIFFCVSRLSFIHGVGSRRWIIYSPFLFEKIRSIVCQNLSSNSKPYNSETWTRSHGYETIFINDFPRAHADPYSFFLLTTTFFLDTESRALGPGSECWILSSTMGPGSE